MILLKLHGIGNKIVFINAEFIVSIYREIDCFDDAYTNIETVNKSYIVKETPDEIIGFLNDALCFLNDAL